MLTFRYYNDVGRPDLPVALPGDLTKVAPLRTVQVDANMVRPPVVHVRGATAVTQEAGEGHLVCPPRGNQNERVCLCERE
jgi:hypothetical protein